MRYSQAPISLLEKFSDAVIPVSDLNPESAKKVFESI